MEDESFPYLDCTRRIHFPIPDNEEGIVGVGGNLSPGMLLSAYEQGVFPWYGPNEPILWWNPPERAVLLPGDLHVSRSMRRALSRSEFRITSDSDFAAVIHACRTIERKDRAGTWITAEMQKAYEQLHRFGYAHSVEAWLSGGPNGEPYLAGGLYGIRLGRAFFGESMFSRVSNSSKAAFIALYHAMMAEDMVMIDCQIMNPHLASLGARNITRVAYLELLEEALGSGGEQRSAGEMLVVKD